MPAVKWQVLHALPQQALWHQAYNLITTLHAGRTFSMTVHASSRAVPALKQACACVHQLVLSHKEERFEAAKLERVAEMLEKVGLYEDLGRFLEGCHMPADAVDAYRR